MGYPIINSFPGYEFRYWREGDPFVDDKKKHNMYRGTDHRKGGLYSFMAGHVRQCGAA